MLDSIRVDKILKHRYPFLLIDRIIDHNYGKYVVGIKNLTYNEPWVESHFPEKPIYPGVLMLETMAQVGGLIFFEEKNNKMGWLAGVDKVKFISSATPGDILIIKASTIEIIGDITKVRCEINISEKKIASSEITYVFK